MNFPFFYPEITDVDKKLFGFDKIPPNTDIKVQSFNYGFRRRVGSRTMGEYFCRLSTHERHTKGKIERNTDFTRTLV